RGITTFLEAGPGTSLSTAITTSHPDTTTIPTHRPHTNENHTLATALATLHTHGTPITWTTTTGNHLNLPTYPFQRERYWPDTPVKSAASEPADERFWEVVANQDVAGFAAALEIGADAGLADLLPALSDWRRRSQEQSTVDGWRYRERWTPLGDIVAALDGRWVLVVPDSHRDDPLVADCVLALAAGGGDPHRIDVGADDADRLTLITRLAEAGPVRGVLSLWGLDTRIRRGSVTNGIAGTLALTQAVADASDLTLWCATSGAVSTGVADRLASPEQAMLWGFGRVAAREQPEVWGGLVDLPARLDDRARTRLVAALAGMGEDQVAIREPGSCGHRIVPAPVTGTERDGWRPSGTVLITGGTGALGGLLAKWLVAGGAEHVVLTTRRDRDEPATTALTEELAALGARVTIARGDVTDRTAMTGLFERLSADAAPLTAVFHAAGVLDDGMLASLTAERFDAVLAAKVTAVRLLQELGAGFDLSAFVCYSSIASVLGGAGQANYAAANAYLDALVAQRRFDGLPGLSVVWGPWAEAGMAAETEAVAERLRRSGISALPSDGALTALGRALSLGDSVVVLADLPGVASAPEAPREAGFRDRLEGTGPLERRDAVLEMVRVNVAAVLGHRGPDAVVVDRGFLDAGFDSLSAVELRNRINAETGLRFPSTFLYDYPNPALMAAKIDADLFGEDAATVDDAPGALEIDALDDETLVKLALEGSGSSGPETWSA
ncbi:SDR family NAD(P)-dependent oxidoreductase, partial [Amycolatopsis minnesotensis]|uniref:SDR family NAD(P)-dependent oxidoreductase n=1 Tax=Amycolatopsis minnesotensis TaxID=337894 RepID=UPI0031DE24A0